MIRFTLSVLVSSAIITGFAGSANAISVGLRGFNNTANVTTFLNNNGFDATQISSNADYTLFDAVVLLRTNPTGIDSTNLINYVQNGGHLVTEWSASSWALNTANLLNAEDTGSTNVGVNTTVTFTTEGLSAGLGNNIGNSYADGGRTQSFRNLSNIDTNVDLLGTRPGNIPVIIGGNSGLGSTIILGYDWADSFSIASSSGEQILINALNYSNTSSVSVPFKFSPTLGFLLTGGIWSIYYLNKKLANRREASDCTATQSGWDESPVKSSVKKVLS